jgi:hypothetical protein
MDQQDSDNEGLEHLLRRAFTEGDRNYDAQFWYSRQLYINGKYPESRERFLKLRDCPMDPDLKRKLRGLITSNYVPVIFKGRITKLESSYCLITRDEIGDLIYVDKKSLETVILDKLNLSIRVRFAIGFTFHGPVAAQLELE